jgi:hypothetical protein
MWKPQFHGKYYKTIPKKKQVPLVKNICIFKKGFPEVS